MSEDRTQSEGKINPSEQIPRVQPEQFPTTETRPDDSEEPINPQITAVRPPPTLLHARNVHFNEDVEAYSPSRTISDPTFDRQFPVDSGGGQNYNNSYGKPRTSARSNVDSRHENEPKSRGSHRLYSHRGTHSHVSHGAYRDLLERQRTSSSHRSPYSAAISSHPLSPPVQSVYPRAYTAPEFPTYESVNPYQASVAYGMQRSNSPATSPMSSTEGVYGLALTGPPLSFYLFAFVTDTIPRQVYIHLLLRLPALYFSRVARIFNDAQLSLPSMKQLALEKDVEGPAAFTLNHEASSRSRYFSLHSLQNTWESFIDSVLREWKTFNIVSVLLLSAILTVLQIDSAAANPVARFSALLSLICALMSLIFGGIYIISFGRMRTTYKAILWAEEAQRTKTVIFWNVWVLLAMPAVWLSWSLISYLICIMAFIWQTGTSSETESPGLSPHAALAPRIILSVILAIGLLDFGLILDTLCRYGDSMDREWRDRVKLWRTTKSPGSTPGPSRHGSRHEKRFDSFAPSSHPYGYGLPEPRVESPYVFVRDRTQFRSPSPTGQNFIQLSNGAVFRPKSDSEDGVPPPYPSWTRDRIISRSRSPTPIIIQEPESSPEGSEHHGSPIWSLSPQHRSASPDEYASPEEFTKKMETVQFIMVGRFDIDQAAGECTLFEENGSLLEDGENDLFQTKNSTRWKQFLRDLRHAWDNDCMVYDSAKRGDSSTAPPQMSLPNSRRFGTDNIRHILDLWYSSFFVHHTLVPFICEEYSFPENDRPPTLWVHLFKEPVEAVFLMQASRRIATWHCKDPHHCLWLEGRNCLDSPSLRLRIDYPLTTATS